MVKIFFSSNDDRQPLDRLAYLQNSGLRIDEIGREKMVIFARYQALLKRRCDADV